jgi:hypothetical protein
MPCKLALGGLPVVILAGGRSPFVEAVVAVHLLPTSVSNML